ncbi:MAG: hypothetical protein PVG78_11970 [Desulfobacterales bacterium]|jgi:hypothetical protein
MADFYINLFLDDEALKKAEAAGLGDQVQEIGGKKGFKVEMTKKDQKKLLKGFEGLTFDADNACELPEAGAKTLLGIILDMKSLDVMKFAITKLYNPLAGRSVSGRGSMGGR